MDSLRLLVQEEGRAARNVVAFHVDLSKPNDLGKVTRKPPTSPRLPTSLAYPDSGPPSRLHKRGTRASSKTGSRVRSASTGRDKKSELQARYWAFLFGNLQRAVDEIYQTCEMDESVSECKEAILVLENFTRDFHNLIEWFKLKWEYENTPPPQRPTSLAWEVRKSSPGKMHSTTGHTVADLSSKTNGKESTVKRQIQFCTIDDGVETTEASKPLALSFGDVDFEKHLPESENTVTKLSEEVVNENLVTKPVDLLNKSDQSSQTDANETTVTKSTTRISQPNMSPPSKKVPSSNAPNKSGSCTSNTGKQSCPNSNIPNQIATTNGTTSQPPSNKAAAVNSVVTSSKNSQTTAVNGGKINPAYGTGRNVSAPVFVPGKKNQSKSGNASQSDKSTNKVGTTGSNQVKPKSGAVNENSTKAPVQESLKKDKKIGVQCEKESSDSINVNNLKTQTTHARSSTIPAKKLEVLIGNDVGSSNSNSTCSSLTSVVAIELESEESSSLVQKKDKIEVKTVDKTPVSSSPIDKIDVENSPVSTDQHINSAVSVTNESKTDEPQKVPEKPSSTTKNDEKSISTVKEKSTTASQTSPITNQSISVSGQSVSKSNESLSVAKCKETRDTTTKPAYSAISKLGRSQTSVEMRSSRFSYTKGKPAPFKGLASGPQGLESSRIKSAPASGRERQNASKQPQHQSNSSLTASSAQANNSSRRSVKDEDGWETVKGKSSRWRSNPLSQSSGNIKLSPNQPLHQKSATVASRFHLPSPATSLPALALASAPSDAKPAVKHRKERRNAEIKNNKPSPNNKSETTKSKTNPPSKVPSSSLRILDNSKICSMGDIEICDGWETVKGKSSRWRSNPLSQSSGNIKLSPNQPLHQKSATVASRFHLPSPATSLPALALVSAPSDAKPAVKHRKERRNAEIKNNKPSPNNKSETTKSKTNPPSKVPSRKNSFSGLFVSKLEVERMFEEDLRKSRELFETELLLTREIRDLEVDTETDGTETDGELTETNGTEEDDTDNTSSCKDFNSLIHPGLSWADQMETLEKLEALMAQDSSSKGMSWPSRICSLEQLEELVARHPGRAIELHQKLSSPSRRRTLPDTIRRHHARQASARQKREQLLLDKTAKLRELLSKVGEVKAAQLQLTEDRRARLEDKLKRAEEKRNLHLSSIRRKAHDEEEKLREIAFINELEAQNKRHDFMALCQEQEERLQGILEERQRRQEEKAAKEAAVEERKRALEAERQEKLEKMQERRRKREERIGREKQEKEKERLEIAHEKARDRDLRLQALQAAHEANVEELQKKIQQKQEDSARRHEENIEQIRQRALETAALKTLTEDEAPRLAPYETKKLCVPCNVLIESEVYLISHLRGRPHQEAIKVSNVSGNAVIVDAPLGKVSQNSKLSQDRERQKALRKRCKKIRSRMSQRGAEYESKQGGGNGGGPANVPSGKGRMMKCLREVERLHTSQGQGQWPNNAITQLERSLAEINRILTKKIAADQMVFRELNGFTILNNILNLGLDVAKNMKPYIPPKCLVTTCTSYLLACQENADNSKYVILSDKITLVLDLLQKQLDILIPEHWTGTRSTTSLTVDPLAGALMRLVAVVLDNAGEISNSNTNNKQSSLSEDLAPALQDVISYSVSIGTVDRLAVYCGGVRDPVDDDPHTASFLLSAIQLITAFSSLRSGCTNSNSAVDPTQLVATLRATELMGAVSLLYGMLMHQGAPPPATPPPPLPTHTLAVAAATVKLLNTTAKMHLPMFQSVVESEGLSLQFRHIASYLLWYCTGQHQQILLHQLVPLIGYFAINHRDNQMMLQSGATPTVLQQLCSLPFEYFSKPELSQVLFPTLLACCKDNADNKAILEQELTYQMLEDFLKTCKSKDKNNRNLLIDLILK
ncbi:S phase cyclin A-associated protein in the endoplasmic reticulum [Nilaparvata lugens]|uniref:S phase cyclin A-associated protein in the endoplasmic reticulum n=1 Tax=Nilaparvata lugens TaxID=108931 RepID=UPI00193D6843|nr:S phase cyclin A-associated protein in the endoplasmic reticulum [Nilaparvata lugens]